MADDNDKQWNRPWSMDEMIENAENWSMAGDVALLNTIKAYADNMLTKSLSISDSVDDLLNDLNNVSLKLDISQNEFQSLRNTQFVESRVYEEDETADIKENIKEEEKEPTEEEKQKMIRDSILEGLRVMDKYFDKIEVSISDSEEDSEMSKSYVLRPKDLYADRPLPLLIGTDEWYKKWHVGLAESSSESDTDKISETYSDSESEDALPKDLLKGSETSSELDFSNQANENRPVANSTFNDTAKEPDLIESDESEEHGSLPAKTPVSDKSFADQLAEKLGNVISEREDLATEVNKRPIQPVRTNKFGDLFSDEPPPLDDLENIGIQKEAQAGLFSGGQGLFDDNEDDLFWGQQNTRHIIKPEEDRTVIKQDPTTSKSEDKTITLPPKSSQVSKGLFDSDDSSDEDIFASSRKQISKSPFLKPYQTPAPLFDEEPPELESEQKKPAEAAIKKKPVGGVSVFGSKDNAIEEALKKGISKKEQIIKNDVSEEQMKSDKLNLFDDDLDSVLQTPQGKVTTVTKKISLFDDDDDLFKEDLFMKQPAVNLFDDARESAAANDNNNSPKVNIFSSLKDEPFERSKTDRKTPTKVKNVLSLFSDNEEDEILERGSTVSKTAVETPIARSEVDKVGFGITEVSGSSPGRLDGEMKEKEFEVDPPENVDDDDDAEGLFKPVDRKSPDNSQSKSELHFDYLAKAPQLQISVPGFIPSNVTKKTERKSVNLFGSSPPPDDDDWDTKSDQFSDMEDQFSYRVDSNAGVSSLFDNEPPSLGPNESSGIVRDQNITRVETDDSSFYPYASSSRRLSSDIFSEQQSQDSFFITKNKTEPVNVTSQLDIIPEDKYSSNFSITPSGKLEDLEDSKEIESLAYESTKSLFDLHEDDQHDDDLFSIKTNRKHSPKLSEKRLSLFHDTDDATEEKHLQTVPSVIKVKVPQRGDTIERSKGSKEESISHHDVKSKVELISEQLQTEVIKEVSKTGSPGKLKHNLNINVGALLPGGAPPRLRDLSKSQSLDLPKEESTTPVSGSMPQVDPFTPDAAMLPEKLFGTALEKAVSFENALDNVEVLHSVTKDRARIPIKRRPSTRRGRREAIRKSTGDMAEGEQKVDHAYNENVTGGATELEAGTVLGAPKADSKLAPPGLDDAFQSAGINMDKVEPATILKDAVDRSELFPVLSEGNGGALPVDKSKSFIFDSGDSDGDLFGPSEVKKPKQENKAKNRSNVTKKSLFNDSSSDDDLFSTASNVDGKRKERPKSSEKNLRRPTAMRKLQNIETEDDPLSSLLK